MTGAYAFLLLALAVQAENDFATPEDAIDRSEEVEALLTNVKVILAGLEAYGVMWAGIEVMAGESTAINDNQSNWLTSCRRGTSCSGSREQTAI